MTIDSRGISRLHTTIDRDQTSVQAGSFADECWLFAKLTLATLAQAVNRADLELPLRFDCLSVSLDLR